VPQAIPTIFKPRQTKACGSFKATVEARAGRAIRTKITGDISRKPVFLSILYIIPLSIGICQSSMCLIAKTNIDSKGTVRRRVAERERKSQQAFDAVPWSLCLS